MAAAAGVRQPSTATRVSSWLHRSPRVRLAALLSAPMVWLVVAYLGSLAFMFVAALWSTDSFTGELVRNVTWDNFDTLVSQPVYLRVALRTIGVAIAVTVIDGLIALPMAFFMAKIATPRWRRLLVVAILTPLWASYLVKAYAWRVMFSAGGVLDWALAPLHASGPGFGLPAVIVTLSYLWLPFMILPVYAGFEKLPNSL
ncbi:MAG: binding-protein-dependent transport system inner rane component, partial [Frankiales bacterium]|nr:binding-protein-dependent transport system inner rane component [Frankiales bacterium]